MLSQYSNLPAGGSQYSNLPMINTLIFDFGGVLIDWNPKYLYSKLFHQEEEMIHFLESICTSEWNEEQDAGRSIEEGTNLLVQQFPEYEENIRAYYGRWEEMLGGTIEGTVEILKRLKDSGQYKMYGLTNWSAETFHIALERFEFLKWFDGIVVSGEEKNRKPFPDFYQLLLDRYNVKPEQALFIDDNQRNVEAAKKMGIETIAFSSPDLLLRELQARKIL
jgi:2-haloacid dehalogenase